MRRHRQHHKSQTRLPRAWVRLCVTAAALCVGAFGAAADTVHVFAAASLKNALDEIARSAPMAEGTQISLTYAGSAALARQIAQGAPADIFISANEAWGAWLAEHVDVKEAHAFTANQLVIVAADSAAQEVATAEHLGTVLAGQRMAIALTDAVPAGIYGREALEHLALWDMVQPHLIEAENVRAALALVALGAVPFGIVYASDAHAEPRVRSIHRFAAQSHSPIRYPALRLSDAPQVRAVYDVLQSDQARAILEANGFTPLDLP